MARIGVVEGHFEGGLIVVVATKAADIIFPRKDHSLIPNVSLVGLKNALKANHQFKVGQITIRNINHRKVELRIEDGRQKSEFWVSKDRLFRYI